MPDLTSAPSPLRIPAFRNLWLGQSISQLGDMFYYIVFMYMVKRLTGSDAMVGFVGAAETTPLLIFSMYAGVLADRINRRTILVISMLASAAILLLFAGFIFAQSKPPVWTLFLTVVGLSISTAFYLPTKQAVIPSIVPVNLLTKANSISMATQNLMPILSLTIGAFALSALSEMPEKWFFLTAVTLNLFTFLLAALFYRRLPNLQVERKGEPPHPWQDFKEGMHYIFRRHDLRALMMMFGMMHLMISPFFVVYIACNDAWFGGKPQTIAILELSFFMGMLPSSLFVGTLKIRRVGWMIGINLLITGLLVAALAYADKLWLFITLNFLAGLFVPFVSIPSQTYVQSTVPEELQGRVNSSMIMVNNAAMPIGTAFGGVILQFLGLRLAFFAMGIGIALAAVIGLSSAAMRNARLNPAARSEQTPAGTA